MLLKINNLIKNIIELFKKKNNIKKDYEKMDYEKISSIYDNCLNVEEISSQSKKHKV